MPNTERYEDRFLKDINEFSAIWKSGIEPAKPDFIIFDNRKKLRFQHLKEKQVIVGCYTHNWEIEWSPYIKTITGFDDPDKWVDSLSSKISELNDDLKDDYKSRLINK
jgi:hypothetical protein